jgi:hypothetical protein
MGVGAFLVLYSLYALLRPWRCSCCAGAAATAAVSGNAHSPFPSRRVSRKKHDMENENGSGIKGIVRWATTPPQSYAVYLVCLFLVAGMSFYVGTLKPKHAVGMAPPAASAPRN